MEDRIISVLIGLVRACESNPKTKDTDRLLIKALAFTPAVPAYRDAEIAGLIDEIRAEKNRVAPGCAACTAPCGNTSDYDMSRIAACEEDIRGLKLRILSELHDIAACTKRLTEPETALLYKALSFVSYDLEKADLDALLAELRTVKNRVEGV